MMAKKFKRNPSIDNEYIKEIYTNYQFQGIGVDAITADKFYTITKYINGHYDYAYSNPAYHLPDISTLIRELKILVSKGIVVLAS